LLGQWRPGYRDQEVDRHAPYSEGAQRERHVDEVVVGLPHSDDSSRARLEPGLLHTPRLLLAEKYDICAHTDVMIFLDLPHGLQDSSGLGRAPGTPRDHET